MTPTGIESTVSQLAGVLQLLFIVLGLTLAFAGRFVHDLFIYASGFVAGSSIGATSAPTLIVGLEVGPAVEFVLTGCIIIGVGILGARIAWQIYVSTIVLVGMGIGYVGLCLVFGVSPEQTLAQVFAAPIAFLGPLAVVLGLTVLPLGYGTVCVLYGIACIRRDQDLLDWMQRIKMAPPDDEWPNAERPMGTVRSAVIVVLGVCIASVILVPLLIPGVRRLVVSLIGSFANAGPGFAVYVAIAIGSLLTGIVVWYLHRIALVVQTAILGAILLSTASVADDLLLAAADLRLDEAIALINPFSMLFIAVVLLGSITQFGLVLGGVVEPE